MNTNYKSLKAVAIGLFAVTGLVQQANAQDTIGDFASVELEQVIISVNKTEQTADETDRSVTIITSEDIEKSGSTNLVQVLRNYGGFNIIGSNQAPGSIQSIFMRGTGSEQTMIMIDGVRLTDPSAVNNAPELSAISLLDIERIEIVRGAHSVAQGNGAVGGVINIITKKGATEGLQLVAKGRTGLFDESGLEHNEQVDLSYGLDNGLYFGAGAYFLGTSGFDATEDTITRDVFKTTDSDDFTQLDLMGRVGYRSDNFDAKLSYKNTSQSFGIDDGAYTDDENHTVENNRNVFLLGTSYKIDSSSNITLNAGYTNNHRVVVDDSSAISETAFDGAYDRLEYFGGQYTADLFYSKQYDRGYLVAGLAAYGEGMSSNLSLLHPVWGLYEADNDTMDLSHSLMSAYLKGSIDGSVFHENLKPLRLNFGVRGNTHSTYGENAVVELGSSYRVDNTTLFGNFSTGFNAPSLYQLFHDSFGNELLTPQKSQSIEVGLRTSGESSGYAVVVYSNVIKDGIEYVSQYDTAGSWVSSGYINLSEFKSTGVEFSGWTNLGKKVTLSTNITLVNSEQVVSEENISDAQVAEGNTVSLSGSTVTGNSTVIGLVRRNNTANLRLDYAICNDCLISARWRHNGSRNDLSSTLPAYSLIDIISSYEISEGFKASLLLENVMNLDYQEIAGFASRGRGAYLTLSYTVK